MQAFIDALTNLPEPLRLGLPLAFLALGIALERAFPLFRTQRPWAHIATNLAMTLYLLPLDGTIKTDY